MKHQVHLALGTEEQWDMVPSEAETECPGGDDVSIDGGEMGWDVPLACPRQAS